MVAREERRRQLYCTFGTALVIRILRQRALWSIIQMRNYHYSSLQLRVPKDGAIALCLGIAFLLLAPKKALRQAEAQDIVNQLEQFQAEAEIMNTPSRVLFDCTILESSESAEMLVQERIVGQRIVGSNNEVRVDVRTTTTQVLSGVTNERSGHFIHFSPTDYLKAFGLFGSDLTIANLESRSQQDVASIAPYGYSNPFDVAMNFAKFQHSDSRRLNFAAIDGLQNSVTSRERQKAGGFVAFEFSPSQSWRFTSWNAFFNPSRFLNVGAGDLSENHLPNWTEIGDPKKYTETWKPVTSSVIEWDKIEIASVPVRIVAKSSGIPKIHDRVTEFEIHYFGYDFNVEPYEKLFDRRRFTSAGIREDFLINAILEQSSAAKKALRQKAKPKIR